jgi:hypothetical protein
MSEVMIALEAGCEQKPKPGVILGLTGTIFSKTAVNITAPAPESTDAPVAAATGLTIGAIVGIAVGAALLFLGGTALFFVYWRRQKKQEKDKQDQNKLNYHRSHASSFTAISKTSPSPFLSPYSQRDRKMSLSIRSMNLQETDPPLGSGKFSGYSVGSGKFSSNADYYDKLEEEFRSRSNSLDPLKGNNAPPNNAMPTHHAYIPRAASRQSSRQPSPQPLVIKSNKPDSYALQQYLTANEDNDTPRAIPPTPPTARTIATINTIRSMESNATYTTAQATPPLSAPLGSALSQLPSPPPPPPQRSRVPTITLPSVPRIKVPKKYSPPKITIQDATPIVDNEDFRKMNITGPLTTLDRRFQDRPLGGGVIYATEAPSREDVYKDYNADIPIVSGKSFLYG